MKLKPNDVFLFATYITGPIFGVVLDSNDERIPKRWKPDYEDTICMRWSDGDWSNEDDESSEGVFLYVGNTTDPNYEHVKFTFALRHGHVVPDIEIPPKL